MTSALSITSTGRTIFPLRQRLLIAFHLHSTLVQVSEFRPAVLKPRPYLTYLAHTLARMGCDLHFITTLDPLSDKVCLDQFFSKHFPVPHQLHFEVPSTSRDGSSLPPSFASLLHRRAAALSLPPEQILFIDSEIAYRYSPLQTIVMEKFVKYTARDKRQAYRKYFGEGMQRMETNRESATAGASSNAFVRFHETQRERLAARNALAAAEPTNPGPFSLRSSGGTRAAAAEGGGGLVSFQAPLPTPLLQDYICVALATIIAELCASPPPLTVREFLNREPLLEQLEVPLHGKCFYLPVDNCEDLELIDWNEVEVQEELAMKREGEPDPEVKETADHKDFFV